MIIKVKNSENSWSYLECKLVHSHHRYCTYESLFPKYSDSLLLVSGNSDGTKMNLKILNLESEKAHFRTIITDQICYVLNNEGKTIDKI